MITRMDRDVGRLMALLKELKLDEKTLVFFASDNGAAYTRHSCSTTPARSAATSATCTRGASARRPSPAGRARSRPGVVSDQVWAFWDFLPTMAELTGQTPPPGCDGISILPALLEGKTGRASAAVLGVPRARLRPGGADRRLESGPARR